MVHKLVSGAAAEADDFATIALGGPAGGELLPFSGGFAFGGDLEAEFAAGVGFAVERLSDGCWAAEFAESENFDFEVATVVSYVQHVADANFAGGLSELAMRLNAAEITGAGGESAGLEETSGPKPLVDPDGRHGVFSYSVGSNGGMEKNEAMRFARFQE